MRISCVRRMSSSVADNLKGVITKIRMAYESSPVETRSKNLPNLIAVSKLKPKENIIEAYNAGQRIFGENYVQELLEKSTDPGLQDLCPDISWHFIGTLQSKNVSKLLRVPRLGLLHTLSSKKLAEKLQRSTDKREGGPLEVLVQVNASREESKGGVSPGEETRELVGFILESCPGLAFRGLMAIGAYERSVGDDHRDFLVLSQARADVARDFELEEKDLRLSMGMSADMEAAVALGSTDVRVGRQIFGERTPKQQQEQL